MAEFQSALEDGVAVPSSWVGDPRGEEAFLPLLQQASNPLLICDYDGTLAPFKEDKMQAVVYPGVAERLTAIAQGRTRLAFVSGRPIDELIQLLPLAAKTEIWGMHGREHRLPGGSIRRLEPSRTQRAALDAAEAQLHEAGLASLLERKTASLALHWRGLEAHAGGDAARLHEVQSQGKRIFSAHAGRDALALLPFDGGLELRAADHTKGHATAALLAGATDPRAAVFLGDDITDEDAFRTMRVQGGLGILVREPPRASSAHYALKPPEELLAFLDAWLAATDRTAVPADSVAG